MSVIYPAGIDVIATVASGGTITAAYQNLVRDAVLAIENAMGVNPTRTVCEGRLSLSSTAAVTTSDIISASTIYFQPYQGERIALYDGTSVWTVLPLGLPQLTLSALSSGVNYDVFCYNASGTPTLELGPAWSSDTARSVNLVLQDGIWVKSGATTRRYLGTIRTTSSSTTEDSAANRLVWNAYNRLSRPLRVSDSTATWTYSTAGWRQANGNAANQVSVVVGLAEATIHLSANAVRSNTSAGTGATAIGVYSTSTPGFGVIVVASSNAASSNAASSAVYDGFPQLGYSFYAWLEYGSGSGTDTWYGTSGPIVSGLSGSIL